MARNDSFLEADIWFRVDADFRFPSVGCHAGNCSRSARARRAQAGQRSPWRGNPARRTSDEIECTATPLVGPVEGAGGNSRGLCAYLGADDNLLAGAVCSIALPEAVLAMTITIFLVYAAIIMVFRARTAVRAYAWLAAWSCRERAHDGAGRHGVVPCGFAALALLMHKHHVIYSASRQRRSAHGHFAPSAGRCSVCPLKSVDWSVSVGIVLWIATSRSRRSL